MANYAMSSAGGGLASSVSWMGQKWDENDGDGKVAAAQTSLTQARLSAPLPPPRETCSPSPRQAYEDNTGRSVEGDSTTAKVPLHCSPSSPLSTLGAPLRYV